MFERFYTEMDDFECYSTFSKCEKRSGTFVLKINSIQYCSGLVHVMFMFQYILTILYWIAERLTIIMDVMLRLFSEDS